MLRCITLRLALPVLLAATLLPALTFAQSQDSQSVAEAARRAREQKKPPAKPAKVITEDDVKPAAQSSTAAPASTAASTDNATAPGAPSASSATAPDAKEQKDSKEVTALKAQLKQAQGELDLLQREQALDQDSFYSNSDYAHDTAGKAKLDAEKQQVSDKQQEVENLKARLAAMLPPPTAGATPPPKP